MDDREHPDPDRSETPGAEGTAPDVAPQSAPVEPHVVRVSEPEIARPDLRKKELIAEVLERCEVKKRDAKPVIEAMLAVLGEALADGRGLNLEPMGKLRINRAEEKNDRRIVVCKLRQKRDTPDPDAPAGGAEPGGAADPDGSE